MNLLISIVGYTLLTVAAVIGLSPFWLGRQERYIGVRRRKGWWKR